MAHTHDIEDRNSMGAESGRLPGIWFFLGAALLVAILYWAQAILIPVALAILLTFLLAPIARQLERWGIYRGLSVSLVVLLTALLLGGMIWLAAMQIRNLADELPHYRANMRQKISDLRELQKSSALDRLNDMFGEVRGELSKDDKTSVPKPSAEAGPGGPAGQPFFWESLKQPIASAGLVLLLLIYMLAQREEMRNRLIRLFGYGNLTITTHALEEMGERVSKLLINPIGDQ